LAQYAHRDSFEAEAGEDGGSRNRTGKSGESLYIDLPVGSLVTNKDTGTVFELTEEGEEKKILSGGEGGYGNSRFKSATDQAPRKQTDGKPGEEGNFYIELKLPVDAGFVGLPNAGKSSLVNELTNAKSDVGSYEFTTLSPHLGDLYGFTIADIPGLIAGASAGKGLGHKFLRHVSRTKMLLHLVSLENEDVEHAYHTIRTELESYAHQLQEKEEWIVITKKDLVNKDLIQDTVEKLAKTKKRVFVISENDRDSIKDLQDQLVSHLRTGYNTD
jgi:GTP-binding protein